MLSVCRRTLANINSNIKYSTLHTAHKFTLSEWRTLEMQSAHHTIGAHALIILYKINLVHLLLKFTLRERLEEIATSIFKYSRLYDYNAINGSFNYVHYY